MASNPRPIPPELRPIVAAAEDYARRGWSVVPLKADKTPAVTAWRARQTERTPAENVAEWFGRVRNVAGVGIILGAVSGHLYVRDFDAPGAYERWAAAHPELAATLPTVRTPSGGAHVYGCWEGVRTVHEGDGELRGEGAYVVAPPSRHESGAVYAWLVPLPPGDVPTVDPTAAGLARSWAESAVVTERTERTENTESTERTETTERTEDTEETDAIGEVVEVRAQIESAIARTLPREFGRRNSHVFKLARALKAIPALGCIPPAKVRKLRPIVAEWHRRAGASILTTDFATTWGDFVHAWERVRWAEGADVLGDAIRAAEISPPPAWAAEYSPTCQLLGSLCRELQRRAGDAPFFLSCAKAGECLGVDRQIAFRWFKAFVADGALKLVSKGSLGTASRWRYIADDLH
jgi:hypothetical protein